MKSLAIIFVVVVIEVQCRSITLSNVKDTDAHRNVHVYRSAKQDAPQSTWTEINVPDNSLNLTDGKIFLNRSEQLKELTTFYEEHFAKLIEFAMRFSSNKDSNEQQMQFINELGSLVEQIIKEQSKVSDMYTILNNVTDSNLEMASNKLMINVNEALKALFNVIKDIVYEDDKATEEHIRIKRAVEGQKETEAFTTLEKHITNMLIDIQRQLVQNRKYLESLCKKHNLSSTTSLRN